MKQVLMTAVVIAAIGIVSCKKSDNNMTGTFNGPEVKMGNGKAHSWVKLDDKGNPTSVGITLDDKALLGLDSNSEHELENTFEMSLPSQAQKTIFKHIVIDWNPNGHPPAPIYTVPHFDFHFYYISSQERKQIPDYGVDSNSFKIFPSPDYLPAHYINTGGGEAQMGTHWVDVTSPELNGQPFTQTFIYGTYNGKVTFDEPMITYAFLQGTTDFSRSIPQPMKVATTAYYPTTLHITHAKGAYTIALEGMLMRTAE